MLEKVEYPCRNSTLSIISHMKKTLLTLALGAMALSASATEYWAPGVNKDDPGTWYDVNKTWYEVEETSHGDTTLCWAASSSNIVSWWQDQNKANLAGMQGVPSGQAEIWQAFQDAFYDAGYDGAGGIGWFFMGDEFLYELDPEYVPRDPGVDMPGGYYKDVVADPESLLQGGSMAVYIGNTPIVDSYISLKEFSSQLVSSISSGCAVSLGLVGHVDYFGGHAITLWGVDYNEESGLIETMYITDSDDAGQTEGKVDGLLTVRCEVATIQKLTSNGYEDVEFFVMHDNLSEDGLWYHGGEYISSFAALNAHATFVPEPATGTLSLLALAGLCARRRRK